MRKSRNELKCYSKIVMIITLFLGMFGVMYSPAVTTSANAVTLSPEAQKCSEEPKKQGKQANPDYKMSWMYSEKKKACFYTFAEVQSNSFDMKSGVRKKDASGNVTEFYIYEKEQSNSALTILSMIELSSGDIVIGGSEWVMSSDFATIGFYAKISADGSVRYKNRTEGQSIEKINTNNNSIVLAGSARHTNYDKIDTYVTPYIVTTDMDGNVVGKKEFENLRGYWFADAKLYKSKYIRTSLGEYKSQSNGTEGPVKWLNAETLSEMNESEVNLEDQTTYTKDGYIKYDGIDITSYDKNGKKLKSVPYTSSVSRAIPLPQQDENTFVIAEIGSTVVLKSISVNGEKGKETVDTKIAVGATDKIDFRQINDTVSLYIIGAKGEEFLYSLDLSKLVIEKTKPSEAKTESKNNGTANQKDASDENKMVFFLMLGAITAAIIIVVLAIVFFVKKRRKKSTGSKTKKKVDKKENQQQVAQVSGGLPEQQQSEYLQPQFNPYINDVQYEEQRPQTVNTEQQYSSQYDAYGNIINEQPYYDGYGNSMSTGTQYDAYGNMINEQPYYDGYGNSMSTGTQYDAYGNVINEQPYYDGYGNSMSTESQYDAYGNGMTQEQYFTNNNQKEE